MFGHPVEFLLGVGAVAITGWQTLDPIIAILVAVNIIWTGIGIIRNSVAGLMDSTLVKNDLDIIQNILDNQKEPEVKFHALQTRQSGSVKIISMHVLVPGNWSVTRGHKLVTRIEKEICDALADSTVSLPIWSHYLTLLHWIIFHLKFQKEIPSFQMDDQTQI